LEIVWESLSAIWLESTLFDLRLWLQVGGGGQALVDAFHLEFSLLGRELGRDYSLMKQFCSLEEI
jgi:hypothetical protein